MKFLKFTTIILALGLANTGFGANLTQKTIDGYTINICDHYKETGEMQSNESEYAYNFCSNKAIATYKKYSQQDINFNKNYVLIKLDKFYFAALNPKTKKVFTFPVAITNSMGTNTGKIKFSKSSNRVCSDGQDVIFNSFAPFYYPGAEGVAGYKMCYEFYNETEGFGTGSIPMIIDLKTGKAVGIL